MALHTAVTEALSVSCFSPRHYIFPQEHAPASLMLSLLVSVWNDVQHDTSPAVCSLLADIQKARPSPSSANELVERHRYPENIAVKHSLFCVYPCVPLSNTHSLSHYLYMFIVLILARLPFVLHFSFHSPSVCHMQATLYTSHAS